MEWSVARVNDAADPVESVLFEPRDVHRLSQLASELPWLSSLDPYRDRQIAGDEITLAKNDVEAALLRHCLEFSVQYASSKGSSLEGLIGRHGFVSGVFGKLKTDSMYQLLSRVIALLETAARRNLIVNVYGT